LLILESSHLRVLLVLRQTWRRRDAGRACAFEPAVRLSGITFYKGARLRETCATQDMAESVLRKMKTLVDEGRYLEKKREPKETLGEFAETYLEWYKGIEQKAYDSKEKRVNLLVGRLGKESLLRRITRADIERYQADRLSTPGQRRPQVKPATVNREIAALKHLFAKAVEWNVLEDNPATGIKLFKETGRRFRYLTPDECQRLLDASSSTMKRVVTLALHTAMRKSDILNLTWEGVNLRERFIELVNQKNGEHSTIPLNQTAIDTLRSIPRRLDSRYVFAGKTPDKPFYDLKRQFELAVKTAGLEG
jgi:integrase